MPDDVLFTWINSSTGKQESKTLKGADMINSREAIGIWKVDNKSWKVYGTTSQLKALSDDYTRAQVDAAAHRFERRTSMSQLRAHANDITCFHSATVVLSYAGERGTPTLATVAARSIAALLTTEAATSPVQVSGTRRHQY